MERGRMGNTEPMVRLKVKLTDSLPSSYHTFVGQFYDLLELFRVGGDVQDTNYIFMVPT